MYLITEPYDGNRVRILAAAKTPAAAERQFERESNARSARGYSFFAPIRYVLGTRRDVANMLDRDVATLPRWPV